MLRFIPSNEVLILYTAPNKKGEIFMRNFLIWIKVTQLTNFFKRFLHNTKGDCLFLSGILVYAVS